MLSHTRYFRTYTHQFSNVSDIGHICLQITWKTFASQFKHSDEKEKEKNKTEGQLQIFLRDTQTQ